MKKYPNSTATARLLFALTGVCLALCLGCNQRQDLPIKFSYRFERQDNMFGEDQYYIDVSVYHAAQQSVQGRYIVRAYGDVTGEGGAQGSAGDNYDESIEAVLQPGSGNAMRCYYYIDHPEFRESNLDPEELKGKVFLFFNVVFKPASSETSYRETNSVFSLGPDS